MHSKECDVVFSRARRRNECIPNPVQARQERKSNDTPEELVLVLHELGVQEVDCGGTHTESLQVSHEGGKEWMMRIELYLACKVTCRPSVRPSVSVAVGARHATAWQKKKIGCKREDTRHTGAINDKVVILIFSDFLLEPVHILQEVSVLPQKTLGLATQDARKEYSRTRSSR